MAARYYFSPEMLAAPFQTVPLPELIHALLVKRLRGVSPILARKKIKDPISNRFVWARPKRHPIIARFEIIASNAVLTDLQKNLLKSYAHSKKTGAFYRISPDFWLQKYIGLSLSGALIGLDEWKIFPKELEGSDIYVMGDTARLWLAGHKIAETSPAFPNALRSRPFTIANARPSDAAILEQMLNFYKNGISRDQAAKLIRKIPGFESVENAHARRVVKNHIPRGRPVKKTTKIA